MDIVAGVVAFFKALATALGLVQQNKDQTTGVELQRGADAEKAYADAQAALRARDNVLPVTRDGAGNYVLPDGKTDPDQRD